MIWMAGPRSKDRDHFERPILQAAFLPWRGSNEFRRDLLRYNNMVAMLLITRDSTSGTQGRSIQTGCIICRLHYQQI